MSAITVKAGVFSLLFALLLGFAACSEEDNFREDISIDETFKATIKIKARHYFEVNNQTRDTAVHNARITLFKTEQERDFENNPVLSESTDSIGEVGFYQLPDSVYFILGEYAPTTDVKQKVDLSRGGEVNFVEVNFLSL